MVRDRWVIGLSHQAVRSGVVGSIPRELPGYYWK